MIKYHFIKLSQCST
ncbi:hypothetical protein F383_16057 [Gossypium arboreum]|uniref:Uncharacterized protein n=1 Tax=Gossypium arboreum TaxID=29729 RepID=A0A0B0MYA2_GOSAR|nr:hypothetical protein F383_28878 [Gossypium arboreum]KHG27310.1 hypothetical protein F383_13329 [Gossypium arboreum]KHG29403.1 hypothetical protein F383_16057 [Gossypium arboreum]